jgi:hypothetical protein
MYVYNRWTFSAHEFEPNRSKGTGILKQLSGGNSGHGHVSCPSVTMETTLARIIFFVRETQFICNL